MWILRIVVTLAAMGLVFVNTMPPHTVLLDAFIGCMLLMVGKHLNDVWNL